MMTGFLPCEGFLLLLLCSSRLPLCLQFHTSTAAGAAAAGHGRVRRLRTGLEAAEAWYHGLMMFYGLAGHDGSGHRIVQAPCSAELVNQRSASSASASRARSFYLWRLEVVAPLVCVCRRGGGAPGRGGPVPGVSRAAFTMDALFLTHMPDLSAYCLLIP